MSIASVRFPTGTYTVTRTAQGSRTEGHYASGASSTFPIVADVQPVAGRELKDLPEGMRAEETLVVYTTSELRALSAANEADTIAIDGESYRVMKVQHFRVLANRYRAWVERTARAA